MADVIPGFTTQTGPVQSFRTGGQDAFIAFADALSEGMAQKRQDARNQQQILGQTILPTLISQGYAAPTQQAKPNLLFGGQGFNINPTPPEDMSTLLQRSQILKNVQDLSVDPVMSMLMRTAGPVLANHTNPMNAIQNIYSGYQALAEMMGLPTTAPGTGSSLQEAVNNDDEVFATKIKEIKKILRNREEYKSYSDKELENEAILQYHALRKELAAEQKGSSRAKQPSK